jgi:hypothetical protein
MTTGFVGWRNVAVPTWIVLAPAIIISIASVPLRSHRDAGHRLSGNATLTS